LAPICTKSFVGWGFAPDPIGGTYSTPQDPLPVFRGPTSKGRGEQRKGREGKAEEWRGREFILCPRMRKEKSAPMPPRV